MKFAAMLPLPLLILAACHQKSGTDGSQLLVNLGADGNKLALDAYTALDTSPCNGAQIIVSGFDDFGGSANTASTANITRLGLEKLVAESPQSSAAASPQPTATAVQTSTAAPAATAAASGGATAAAPAGPPASASLAGRDENGVPIDSGPAAPAPPAAEPPPPSDLAAVTIHRRLIVGLDVCIVVVPVNPLGPALIQKVAHDSAALRVYSLGERDAGSIAETGYLNYSIPGVAYYNADGSRSTLQNTSTKVVESDAQPQAVYSTWSQQAVAEMTMVKTAQTPRQANNYICNATGYVIAATIGRSVEYLPGLTLDKLPTTLRQGFLHLAPTSNSAEDVAHAVRSMLTAETAAHGG